MALPPDVCKEVGEVLARVGDKWSILVIRHLREGPVRFNDLRRDLGGITHKVLTSTLRGLERDGFILRTVTPTVPPRVDYALTELGQELMAPIDLLATWALRRRDAVHHARAAYDAREEPPPRREPS
ncbi:helix-turn-helix domain-containing protein [Comamonas sp. JC664]|uniref:winged helix-turn-helix transcriptional regulator n=1 Tax=Comamonas sp. JC664 TaxID=2801917 RepID=UPI00191FBC4F|nr:helix-turn-helix domain-containing protein [Comamonas sp. JC664]MBL0699103.1 helix-turn-helix transcriptional regulator [Comamonas sp. JC664]